jgi:hypothetical protein
MISVSIKNSILFLLIIILLYSILNNYINNKIGIDKSKKKESTNNENQNNLNDDAQIKVDLNYPRSERDTSSGKLQSTSQFNEYNINNINLKQKELYDYVYDDGSKDNLNSFYEVSNNYEKSNKLDPEIKCADNICSNKNFCNTTTPTKQELKGHYSGFNLPQCKGDITDHNKNAYIIKKYNGEKELNGGGEGVLGYDMADASYFSPL